MPVNQPAAGLSSVSASAAVPTSSGRETGSGSGTGGGGIGGGSSGSGGSSGGLFQCGDCKRTYTRADHLARHVRSHTQEKPFPCTICLKKFSRADLLKRHFLNHDENNDSKRLRRQRPPTAPGRVTQACRACAMAKLKCEEQKPCHRCQQKGMTCEYTNSESERLRKQSRVKLKQESPGVMHGNILYTQSQNPSTASFADANYVTTSFPETQVPTPETLVDGSVGYAQQRGDSYPMTTPYHDFGVAMQIDQRQTPESQSGIQHNFVSMEPSGARNMAPSRDLLNFGMMTNLEMNDMDFGMLDSYNDMLLSTFGQIQQHASSHHSQSSSPSVDSRTPIKTKQLALGVEAFQKSHMRWTPQLRDCGNSEHENFSLPSSSNPLIRMSWRAVPGRLDQAARDRILSVVLTQCDFSNRLQAVSSFPSAELLDNLMNLYFHTQHQRVDCFIHFATFQPSTCSPELLTAVVASGAILTPFPAVRKLGYALQEAVRNALPLLFEANNAYTRDLSTTQSYLMHLEIALWSGNKRRSEIAESFRQPMITMLRRSGKFRRAQYPQIFPTPCLTGEELEKCWRAWIRQQEYLRLVYRVFIHDVQGSIAYLVNPVISYAELTLPLPESRQLFMATTAEEWKEIYLSSPIPTDNRVPSFIDGLHDYPNLTINTPPGSRLDHEFTELLQLYGIWGRAWEYRQRQAILRMTERPKTPPVDNIEKNFLEPRFSSPQCRLLLELIGMTLYVSLEDLQAFAGKEEEEESLRVYPILQTWVSAPESRLAVWHAGQLLREARRFPQGELTNFWAVAVYHAAITVWAFGALSDREIALTPNDEELVIVLDGNEVKQAREAWVEFGRGTPRIRSENCWQNGLGPADIDVYSPGAVMDAACGILAKYSVSGDGEQVLPQLVENLMVLMEELGQAAEKER